MIHSNDNKAHAAAFSDPSLGVVLTKFLRQLKYQTPAHASHDGTRPAMEAAMLEYAAGSGVSYEPERARSMFDAGLDIACTSYPSHNFAVKLHIAIYTWLAICIDDDEDGADDLAGFHTRFFRGDPQPSALLSRFAEMLQGMSMYFEPLATNFIVLAALQFLNATLLEIRGEVVGLQHCSEASHWPSYFRVMSGQAEVYAYFVFLRDQCPERGPYMQGIPDMVTSINYTNDILSFHKETLAGETGNYINLRAVCEQREPLAVLETVVAEAIAANSRVVDLLRTRSDPIYARKWDEWFHGFILYHLTTRRYKLDAYPGLAQEGVDVREESGGELETSERPVIEPLECA